MATHWNSLPPTWPIHGQVCVCRRVNYWESFEAEYDAERAVFIFDGGQECPWWVVATWKPLV